MTHGHFLLNGKRFDIPSLKINPDDVLEVRKHSKNTDYFKRIDENSPAADSLVSWISVDRNKLTIKVSGTPSRDEAEPDINEQLIVEYYSR